MQGFIISVNRAKDEDTVVTIITHDHLYTLYRFYGARHSTVNIGYKIDFEIEDSHKTTISRLRHVLQISYPWLRDRDRLYIWQQFIKLFQSHLRDSTSLDSFYFELLDACAAIWDKQNPKRVVVEAYTKLLEHEGRLHSERRCFLCEGPLNENYTMLRAFLPAHEACAHKSSLSAQGLEHLIQHHDSIMLNDKEVSKLYDTVLEGL